mmetsp:Transcript_81152/g.161424  ORF Transcript_81152/g.161424 Transcript_81152/m.161424 type:complete len:143 (-) Transcript_81152:378-806(-)
MYELSADAALGTHGGDWFGYNQQGKKAHSTAGALLKLFELNREMEALKKTYSDLDAVEMQNRKEDVNEKIKMALFAMMIPKMEMTVAVTVSMCCADTSVSKEIRRQRAHGIIELGRLFQKKRPNSGCFLSSWHRTGQNAGSR